MSDLRLATLVPLLIADAPAKARATLALDPTLPVDIVATIAEPAGIPGRPERPRLVDHIQLKAPSLRTPAGVAALVHAIAHIELNAIDLALDICWRFAGMPEAFYRDWLRIAQEEAKHFTLLREHLLTLGFDYGHFDAHNALWEMAERTRHDLLARIALVPRTLEARGLDATPQIQAKLQKVASAHAKAACAILDLILREEVGHVATGNRWYAYLCERDGLDPARHYPEVTAAHRAPRLKPPFNLQARRAAGFSEAELASLPHEA